MIGTRLGSYEITAKLGQGGMGEVYRATDTRLKREVAIKVVPAAFIQDTDRLARLEREAQLLAQLHHPNIASIFGLEESGGTRALVMELVEGPTLAERLERGPLPFTESLAVALQIAQALEEAHDRGIVHRDLKPQNIKAPIEGRVKVLDFGLAKAMEPAGGLANTQDMAHSPTVTVSGTRDGVILGTAAYMAPEQARGGAIDKRADIWAFGVVLYEMFAGERLFAGQSVVDTLSAVMRQPIDFDRLPAGTPRPLRELLRRCLERDPKRRLRDIGDARLVLEDLASASEPALVEAGEALGGATAPRRARRRWLALAAVGASAALVGVIAGARVAELRRPAAKPSFRFQKLTYLNGVEWAPELSADGKTLFFAAGDPYGNSELYAVPAGGKKPTSLTPGIAAFHDAPRLSPDGNRLVFASSRDGGGLFLMGTNGESVRRLSEVGHDPAWSPDGRSIVYSTLHAFAPWEGIDGGTLGVLDVATGARRDLASGDGRQAAWSPSGRRIAYWGMRADGDREIWTIDAAGGEPNAVASDKAIDWNPVWSADGKFLYFLSDRGGAMNLWRVAMDESTGRELGAPESVPLPADEVIYLARSGTRWVYAAYSERSNVTRLEFDPGRSLVIGGPHLVLSTTRSVRSAVVSPDGRLIGFSTMRPQEDLYVVAAQGGVLDLAGRIYRVFEPGSFPVGWYPDGRRLLILHDGRLATLDLTTWSAVPVAGSPTLGVRLSASRDLRTLVMLEDDRQADVWLAEEISAK